MTSQASLAYRFNRDMSTKRSSHKGSIINSYKVNIKSDHIRAWQDSGLSKANYAKINKLPESTFREWTRSIEQINENRSKLPRGGSTVSRVRTPNFLAVENEIVSYLDKRYRLMFRDKVGMSRGYLQEKAKELAEKLLTAEEYSDFKASSGWLTNVLKRNQFVGMNLHGEANECNPQESDALMKVFRKELSELMEKNNIPVERLYNADQTGLFYQKLPNHAICRAEDRKNTRGCKAMRDKNRLTLMVCTGVQGDKVPLAVVGTAVRPQCWDLCYNTPPLPYTNQENAWFDRKVTIWWINHIFKDWYKRKNGERKCILILDNCPAHHGIDEKQIAPFIILKFLPPKLTALHQPADQGMIALIKLGYKTTMLNRLLDIFDATTPLC